MQKRSAFSFGALGALAVSAGLVSVAVATDSHSPPPHAILSADGSVTVQPELNPYLPGAVPIFSLTGPMHVVCAMALDDDGELTEQFVSLTAATTVVSDGGPSLSIGTQDECLDRVVTEGVMSNQTGGPIAVFYIDGGTLTVDTLEHGEGLLVGDISMLLPTHVRRCVCSCTTEGNGGHKISLDCNVDIDEPCECDALHDKKCFVFNEDGELVEGVVLGCEEQILPR